MLRAIFLIDDVEGLVALLEPFRDEGKKNPDLFLVTVVKDTDMTVGAEYRLDQGDNVLGAHVRPPEADLSRLSA
ncbi:MAG: hypothetical protein ACREX9_04670 [Gammaproteobacteria bacterium]